MGNCAGHLDAASSWPARKSASRCRRDGPASWGMPSSLEWPTPALAPRRPRPPRPLALGAARRRPMRARAQLWPLLGPERSSGLPSLGMPCPLVRTSTSWGRAAPALRGRPLASVPGAPATWLGRSRHYDLCTDKRVDPEVHAACAVLGIEQIASCPAQVCGPCPLLGP